MCSESLLNWTYNSIWSVFYEWRHVRCMWYKFMTTLKWYSLLRIQVASCFVCICWMSFVSHQESCGSLRRWIIVAGPPCHRSKNGCKRKAGVAGGYIPLLAWTFTQLISPEKYWKNASWKTMFLLKWSFSGNMLIFGDVIEMRVFLGNLVEPCKKTNLETGLNMFVFLVSTIMSLCHVIWLYRPGSVHILVSFP